MHLFHVRKTEIAKFAVGPKLQGPFPENAPARKQIHRSENFGDLTTADHEVLGKECESCNGDRYAVIVRGTRPFNGFNRIRGKKSEKEKESSQVSRAEGWAESRLFRLIIAFWQSL